MDTTEQWRTRIIRVYREDRVWDRYARWFYVPQADLDRLWITEYRLTGDLTEQDVERAAADLRKEYPDAVLVY
jgi:hypothetical protein